MYIGQATYKLRGGVHVHTACHVHAPPHGVCTYQNLRTNSVGGCMYIRLAMYKLRGMVHCVNVWMQPRLGVWGQANEAWRSGTDIWEYYSRANLHKPNLPKHNLPKPNLPTPNRPKPSLTYLNLTYLSLTYLNLTYLNLTYINDIYLNLA